MLTAGEFSQLISVCGKPVTWTQAQSPFATAAITALVQSTAKAQESIVNAFGVNGVSIQVAVSALPVPPQKFDTFTDATGQRFVIDTVVAHEERMTGAPVSFTCYSKGK